MKSLDKLFISLAMLLSIASISLGQTLPASFSAQVEEDEIDAFSDAVDQAFFNVQGDDDNFTVYSFADFDTSGLGLSGLGSGDVTDLQLDLTQSNAFFSADGGLLFYLAEDTRAVDTSDSARYQQSGDPLNPNNGADVVGAAFGTLHALGGGSYIETATGDTDSFSLSLDAAGEAYFLSQVNSGGILRIIGTPADAGVQATYSGATSLLDPMAPPTLSFTAVPEPASALMLLCGLMCGMLAVRRR